MSELLVPSPDEKFDVILADPPWSFRVDNRSKGSRTAASFYRTLRLNDIKALPVASIAEKNCVLFLWVPNSQLREGLGVVDAWGFEYVTNAFTWIKMKKDGSAPRMGMGHYTRQYTEECWLCKRGKIPVVAKNVPNIIFAPRREHSRKPDEQYVRIQRLYPERRYLELFARTTAPGWTAWGLETQKFDAPTLVAA